ncbi:MAG: hypothetical protein MSC45_00735 [Mobiluncus sp.]|uniref:SHOCT domain-containing protein n=1 Tax=Mobiluncus sp. TaxID=47293 RepID=UPI00258EBC53|nr:SHOCT domain-containing protein [Mobiluncus sp.]MCI6583580.1 hypothetical protein [Mobiluncus sp.]
MTRAQLQSETTVRATLTHATALVKAGIITRADYERIERVLIAAHNPPISRLTTPETTG